MSLFNNSPKHKETDDVALVGAAIEGSREAFSVIVARYQNLLCTTAYALVGDIKHSEDIAQEAFIEAWKRLDTLKEPEKLKSWLCGIVRFKVSHFHRKEASQPFKHSTSIEGAQEDSQPKILGEIEQSARAHMGSQSVESGAIDTQEQALLWQTLEGLPENYRTPLILFYREQCSIERMAGQLELTEATAKQRLSRGRKLLQEAMLEFVEQTLIKSTPGLVFTTSVITAIANIPAPAKAAALGAGAVKAGAVFKWSSVLVVLASFSGLISAAFGLRASLAQARTQRERNRVIKVVGLFLGLALVFVVGMVLLRLWAVNTPEHAFAVAVFSQVWLVAFILAYTLLVVFELIYSAKFRAAERELEPEAFERPIDAPHSKRREYKSRATCLGVPLVHFKLGMPEVGDKPAFAWIAGGNQAYGLLFAWGLFAIAPLSVGVVSVGFIGIGAIGLGLFALGTVAIGLVAFGTSSIGVKAFAALSALGWDGAISGGFSMAKSAALGPVAFAEYTNSEYAAQLANQPFLSEYYPWVLGVMAMLVIVPAAWYFKQVKKRMG